MDITGARQGVVRSDSVLISAVGSVSARDPAMLVGAVDRADRIQQAGRQAAGAQRGVLQLLAAVLIIVCKTGGHSDTMSTTTTTTTSSSSAVVVVVVVL